MKHDTWLSTFLGLAGLLAWEAAVRIWHTSPLVLPAPSVVAQSLWQGLVSGYLWPHMAHTLLEVVLGLALGGSMGFVGGVVLGESARMRGVLMPYVVISQVIPKLALAPLFIVWFGFGTLPTVVMTALICFFPLLENTATSMQQVSASHLELFRMLRASAWQTLWRLKIPTGLPHIMAGLRVAVVLAWVGAVVGEFIGASRGLGALIIAAQGTMDTPLMFAVLTVITVLGLAFYKATEALERLWRPIAAPSVSKRTS
jgi:NitT/TauT family transport system permease protein